MAPLNQSHGPIRVLVVDDELLARRNLTVLLRRDPDIPPSPSAGPARKRSKQAKTQSSNLVFL